MPVGGKQVPSSPLVSTTQTTDPLLEGHVFQSGIHKPEHSSVLSYMYPQYYLQALLERIGAEEMVSQSVFSWNEMNRTRSGAAVSSASGDGTTTATFDVDATDYFIVGDLLRFDNGAVGRVSAVNSTTNISVIKLPEGATWNIGITAGDDIKTDASPQVGHIGNIFEEGSSAPKGRVFLPEEKINYTHTIRRTVNVTGTELTNKTYIGDGGPWFFTNEELTLKEFARDKEGVVMFGVQDGTGTFANATRGIWDYVKNQGGVENTYASGTGIVEADLQNQIVDLVVAGGSSEYTVLCGSEAYADIQQALALYAINGSMSYGSYSDAVVGLDFKTYDFFGKKINLVHYELFDDPTMLPFRGTNSATEIDFRFVTLWLDMGLAAAGEPNIKLCYKNKRKFVRGIRKGMTDEDTVGPNGEVATGDDRLDIYVLSEFATKVRNIHRQGILRPNS